jgi:hypothetical protein
MVSEEQRWPPQAYHISRDIPYSPRSKVFDRRESPLRQRCKISLLRCRIRQLPKVLTLTSVTVRPNYFD